MTFQIPSKFFQPNKNDRKKNTLALETQISCAIDQSFHHWPLLAMH